MKRIWQKAMISMALNQNLKTKIQNNNFISKASQSFVGGNNETEAIKKSIELKKLNILTSFFSLGEYAKNQKTVENTCAVLNYLITMLKKAESDIHISVDPTQMGLIQNYSYCEKNIKSLAKASVSQKTGPGNIIMIDMEDYSVNKDTLKIYNFLKENNLNAGITLQAYLKKTKSDLEKIYQEKGIVRLVKGAFSEKNAIAFTSPEKIDREYLALADFMLDKEYISSGSYPVFATHDHKMIKKIKKNAIKNKIEKNRFEFEMLYGVRPSLQKELVNQGYRLRLYLPFGKDWWPYTIRRGGESFKNLNFILKSIFFKG